MHEVALQAGHAANDDMQPPFNEDALKDLRPTQAESLSSGHITSISTCLATVHSYFDTFLSLALSTVRDLPTLQFVRVVYAAVVLAKMAYDTTFPNSEIGKMLNISDFQFGYYVGTLIDRLKLAGENDRCVPAAKFAVVLMMLQKMVSKLIDGNVGLMPSEEATVGKAPSSASQWPLGQMQDRFEATSNENEQSLNPNFGQQDNTAHLVASVGHSMSMQPLGRSSRTENALVSEVGLLNYPFPDTFMGNSYDFPPFGFDAGEGSFPTFLMNEGLFNPAVNVNTDDFSNTWSSFRDQAAARERET